MTGNGSMRREIRSDRLLLRPLRMADAGPITLWCGQYRVASMLARVPHPYPPGAAESFIERSLAGKNGESVFAIDGSASGAADFLGTIGLKAGDDERGFGYWLGPPAWGLGYATEAGAALLEEAFTAGLQAVTAGVYIDNLASRRVLEKLGFAKTGSGEGFCPARGAVVPECRMRLLRTDWKGAAAVRAEATIVEATAADLREDRR